MTKGFIKNFLIFIVLLFSLDFAIGKTLRYFYFHETWGQHYRTTYSIEKTNADILIFGSSRANHHYVPEIFEDSLKMTYYNTGRENNGILFQIAVLKSVLKRYTPKVIVLDFSGGFSSRDNNDYLSSLLPYYKTHEEIRDIIECKSPFERIKLISEIYPFNSEILKIIVGNTDFFKNKLPNDNKGYTPLNGVWNVRIDTTSIDSIADLDHNKINYFREFLKISKSSGAKTFVIYSPIFLKYNRNQEINICNDICSSENIRFYDFSNESLFIQDNNLFYDYVHLNHTGAIKFSNLIVNKMKHE